MKTLTILSFIVAVHTNLFSQCDEYFINELISGSDEKCYFSGGSPIRFCPTLRGVSLNGYTFDTYQWDGISTQYITLSKDGGIAGTLVLKLKEKELVVNLNGCEGSRTYSISFSPNEYDLWVANKPIRDKEKADRLRREQEKKIQEELKAQKIQKIIKDHKLDNYFVLVDTIMVNNAIRNNVKFRKILELYKKDTLVIEFRDGKISDNATSAIDLVNNYCDETWNYVRTGEFRNLPIDEQRKIESSWYNFCRREKSAYGYQNFSFKELFRINQNLDTIIEGEHIPLKNFRVTIIFNRKTNYNTNLIQAPQKFSGNKLYYFTLKSTNKDQEFDGYFSSAPVSNYEDVAEKEKCQITYSRTDKYMFIEGTTFETIFANGIFISTINKGKWRKWYEFKKGK